MSAQHTPGPHAHTLNGIPWEEFEVHFRAVHELMCRANLIGGGSCSSSFKGWTADGRAVTHRFMVSGYERTGPAVEKERAAIAKANVMRAHRTQGPLTEQHVLDLWRELQPLNITIAERRTFYEDTWMEQVPYWHDITRLVNAAIAKATGSTQP